MFQKIFKNNQIDKKILVTGNPNCDLAEGLNKKIKADFISRANGFDLSKKSIQEKCTKMSLNYDVFISCSYIGTFVQVKMLEMIYKYWIEQKHKGYIICFGSTADLFVKGTSWLYPIEKKALKSYCLNLSLMSLGSKEQKPSGVRITYISPGYINTPSINKKYPSVKKLEPDYLADVIVWLLNQPESVNIREIAMDPIQVDMKGSNNV